MLWYAKVLEHIDICTKCFSWCLWACLGQVYYTLLQEREEKGIKDVAISRLEQISPFPYDLVGICHRFSFDVKG